MDLATATTDPSQPILLVFPNHLRIAGDVLTGYVDLNVPLAQQKGIDQVQVKLRGAARTRIMIGMTKFNVPSAQQKETVQVQVKLRDTAQTQTTTSDTTDPQTEWFVREDMILWTLGGAFPDPGSHVLRLPFTFQLPNLLPPSFHYNSGGTLAHIGYSIEVVGRRPGLFTTDYRVGCVFPLLPAADPRDVSTRMSLRSGWTGNWKKD